MKWEPHLDSNFLKDDLDLPRWSLTLNSKEGGWKTDHATRGYGLPLRVAQWICDILNEYYAECPFMLHEKEWKIKSD